MSQPPRYTIRFTDEDYAMLDAICLRYGLKRPDALRHALRLAGMSPVKPQGGYFTPASGGRGLKLTLGGRHDPA